MKSCEAQDRGLLKYGAAALYLENESEPAPMHGRKIYHDKGPSHATHYILAANQDVLSRHSYFGSRVSNLKTKQSSPLGIRWNGSTSSVHYFMYSSLWLTALSVLKVPYVISKSNALVTPVFVPPVRISLRKYDND